jgi:hypothetical protein
MAVHAAFAKELAGLQYPNHRLFSLLRYDNNLDPTFLNIEDGVGSVALGEDNLALANLKDGLSIAHFGEKLLGIECSLIDITWHVGFVARSGKGSANQQLRFFLCQ